MMKNPTKLIALLSGVALSSVVLPLAVDAQTVATDPVGYVTVTINGHDDAAAEAFTYMGVPLHQSVDSAGAVSSFAANSITSSGAAWGVDAYAGAYYVQVTSGDNAGISATIASNTADVLTTVEDLSSFLVGGESISIYPYTTLADVFGAANESGLAGGATASSSDNILVQNGEDFDTYYYKNAGLIGGNGWRSSASPSVDASLTPLPYGSGIIVVRRQASDIDLVVSGAVFPTDAISPVEAGYNWKAPSIPVNLTLSGLFGPANEAGLTGGASASGADNILVFDATGNFDTYYYKNAGLIGGNGWRSSASPSVDEGDSPIIGPGDMYIINRIGGEGFNLTETSPL